MYGEAFTFLDRPLKANEHGHHRCKTCGATFSADGAARHMGKCKGKSILL